MAAPASVSLVGWVLGEGPRRRLGGRAHVSFHDDSGPTPRSRPARRRRPAFGILALDRVGARVISFVGALVYGVCIALRTYEVDLGVYLRLGGRYIFTSHLYSVGLPNTSLLFTHPPFAALLFAPWQRAFTSVAPVQTVWTMVNVAALLGLLIVSLRVVRPDLSRRSAWRLALVLSLPALLLNPVLITIGFGQVNLVVALLIMWDLLSERRIGRWQAPMGVAAGPGRGSEADPAPFVPFLLLTRRFRAAFTCIGTFVVCELITFVVSPASSSLVLDQGLFNPGRAGDLSIVDNQNLPPRSTAWTTRLSPAPFSCRLLLAAAAGPLACGDRIPPVLSDARRPDLRRDRASSCHRSRGLITWCGSCRPFSGLPSPLTGPGWADRLPRQQLSCSGVPRSGGSPTNTRQTSTSTPCSSSPATRSASPSRSRWRPRPSWCCGARAA